jgi:hypothetical protein
VAADFSLRLSAGGEKWNGGIMGLKETKFKAHILLGFSYFIGVF